ncbi:MAG TPA: endolytic transglycosylase MltG [Jiangellaceae bacterium]|nr:endolytic transglycosylase MltG [Jiangellaceae bacterium]
MSYFDELTDEETYTPRRERRRRRRKRRGFGSFLAVVLSLAVVGGIVYGAVTFGREWLGELFAGPADYEGPGQGSVEVTIPPGATIRQIGNILVDADVVASSDAFVNAAQDHPDGLSIQAGDYTMMQQMNSADAVEALLGATAIVGRVTIPEGFRTEQVVVRIAEETEFTEEDLNAAIERAPELGLPEYAGGFTEGFLFPATYDIRPDTTAESLIQLMINRFIQAAEDVDLEARAEAAGYSPLEVVTMASIIQREVRHVEDMTNVAEVIYNRLAGDCAPMGVPEQRLQMDSTVHYALNSYETVYTTEEERATDSPYNTYRNGGLPPGPIALPGEDALNAALAPSGEDYCYFVTVDLESGETRFAVTEAEHQANVAESRS